MRRIFARAIVAAAIPMMVAGCAHNSGGASGVPKDFSASLVRSACFGTCPVYRVEIDADGTVTYNGLRFVAVSGQQTKKIPADKVRDLYRMIAKANVFALEDHYAAQVTDLPTYELSVTYNGQTKQIEDYAGRMVAMPKIVTDLEKEIDAVAGTQQWVKGGGR